MSARLETATSMPTSPTPRPEHEHETYTKLFQREHILVRSVIYVGDVHPSTHAGAYTVADVSQPALVQGDHVFSDGLHKIVDVS